MKLDLYNSGGTLVASSGNVLVGASYVALTATSLGFDVARFVVSNQGGGTGQRHGVFVDDLTFDNGVAPADFSLGAPSYAAVAHHSSVTVPLSISHRPSPTGRRCTWRRGFCVLATSRSANERASARRWTA